MSNFLAIRDNAFVKLAERSGATFSEAEMNTFINREYEYLQTVIVNTSEDFFAKSATFNASGEETYQFPQDILKLLLLEELQDSGSPTSWREMVEIPIYKKEAYKQNTSFSFIDGQSGRKYYIKGDCFGIVPIKPASTNSLRITYVPILPVLDEDADVPAIPAIYHELLEIGAVNRARRAIKEPPIDADNYAQMLESLVNTIQPRSKQHPRQVRMMRGMY